MALPLRPLVPLCLPLQTDGPGGVRGDLLVAAAAEEGAAGHAAGRAGGGVSDSRDKAAARLVTFHEYLDQVRSSLAA